MNNVQRPTGCQGCRPLPSNHIDSERIIDDGQAYNPLLGGTLAIRDKNERSPCSLYWLYPPTLRSNSRVYPKPTDPGVYMQPYMNKEYNNVIPDGYIADQARYIAAVELAKANEIAGKEELKAIHNHEKVVAQAAQSTDAIGLSELAATTPTPGNELEDVAEDFGRPPFVIPFQENIIEGVESPMSINRFVQTSLSREAQKNQTEEQSVLTRSSSSKELDLEGISKGDICIYSKKIFGISIFSFMILLLLFVLSILVIKKYTA